MKKNKKINLVIKNLIDKNNLKKIDLNYNSNFQLLIAVILSARCKDITVNKITSNLFKFAKSPSEFLELGEEKLMILIKSIGLYKNKTKYILNTCNMIINTFYGKIPNNRIDLEKLPGVGRKTANVVLNIAFNKETIGIDTHIIKILNRTKIFPTKKPILAEKFLMENLQKKYIKDAHRILVTHGKNVCKSRYPKCYICKINNICEWSSKE